jgi:hypothetical protein
MPLVVLVMRFNPSSTFDAVPLAFTLVRNYETAVPNRICNSLPCSRLFRVTFYIPPLGCIARCVSS